MERYEETYKGGKGKDEKREKLTEMTILEGEAIHGGEGDGGWRGKV